MAAHAISSAVEKSGVEPEAVEDVALGNGAPWWTVVGPVVMSFFLMQVSGVTLLEKSLKARKPEYAEYVRRTSTFFPWPPKPAEG